MIPTILSAPHSACRRVRRAYEFPQFFKMFVVHMLLRMHQTLPAHSVIKVDMSVQALSTIAHFYI